MPVEALPAGGSPERPRVFGIGLNKTGTSSFHEAMTVLGYTSLHWGGPSIRMEIEKSIEAGEPLLTRLDPAFDAFSDIEVLAKNFALLDQQYPGSRFVLTVRPIDAWIDSRRRHVENNIARKAAGEYDGFFLEVDEKRWRRQWKRHVSAAREYFAGRDDFVEVDITDSPTWQPFCTLLGIPEPEQPFPWENKHKVFEPRGDTP
ncbi:MAG: sulfotransferase [Acidimicrobiales bacterium]